MKAREQNDYFIGLDLGTSSIKGVLINQSGDVISSHSLSTNLTHPQDGWVELEPLKYYYDICAIIQKLVVAAGGEVKAIAMAAASGNTMLSTENGVPLTNIISWLDQRKTRSPSQFSVQEVKQITGWPCVDSFPLAHLSWLRCNRPEFYEKADKYCMNTDWLAFKMTRQWAMDYSTATTFHLQDQVNRKYHQPYLEKLGIQEENLSSLIPSGKIIGNLTSAAAKDTGLSMKTVMVSGCFDHPAAARAAGVLEPGQLLLSCGTSWVGFFPDPSRENILKAELLCDPFLSDNNGPWGAIFSVSSIGRTIDWYVENLIAPNEKNKFQVFDELAAKAHPGAGGLKIDLRKTPAQINDTRENISRAVMESAAELLNEKLKNLASYGIEFKTAIMVGGPSKSPIWPSIIAETTNLELSVACQFTGAKGAAMLAGIGVGTYKNERDAYGHVGDKNVNRL